MKTSSVFRRAIQALLPATLLLAACGKSDTPAPTPAADQGKIAFVNASSHVSSLTLKFLVDNSEKASLAYGASSGYQTVAVGNRSVQVTSGSQTALTQTAVIEKDKNYTFVSTPAATTATVGGMLYTDDLTAPSSGKAKIRLINLGQNLTTPIRLSQVTAVAGAGIIVNDVAANAASTFIEFIPGNNYNLFVSDNANNPLVSLGDGSGSGTGTKNFEAGKIYTVVVSGTQGSLTDKLKAYLSQNN